MRGGGEGTIGKKNALKKDFADGPQTPTHYQRHCRHKEAPACAGHDQHNEQGGKSCKV
jgi:hypothetical protein